ncbi:MAG: bifunctional phosphoribosyl-AMP cyclohydrolase/phosphoribosyl-ATP diphosphatase HisIE [Paludibacteraceae bacterium]|jgi:phosphoribosyl-ATP pyrophosphohydrolase/phosphoribosyl-AMP cyclohydrolase|nr:bifunctional phosphoribosyl-AMP cyclohydrolase/phosphoribosyl-ATP diphosphatase HisIE [Paludibacteraceae bacterium]
MKDLNIDFEKQGGLVPAIVQDALTGKVLMLAYMNEESLQKTLDTKLVTFYSRSRKSLWTKGETSGNYLHLVSIASDCDNDTLLVKVHPDGPACHTGTDTCWGEENKADAAFLSFLQEFIDKRHEEMPEGSYTTKLFKAGTKKMAQKVGEEAVETILEASSNGKDDDLIYEAADLIYHLIVLLTSRGLSINDVARELKKRHGGVKGVDYGQNGEGKAR